MFQQLTVWEHEWLAEGIHTRVPSLIEMIDTVSALTESDLSRKLLNLLLKLARDFIAEQKRAGNLLTARGIMKLEYDSLLVKLEIELKNKGRRYDENVYRLLWDLIPRTDVPKPLNVEQIEYYANELSILDDIRNALKGFMQKHAIFSVHMRNLECGMVASKSCLEGVKAQLEELRADTS